MRRLFQVLVVAAITAMISAQSVEDFEFELESLGGQTLRQDDFRKSVLIVDFWGTWCRPCRDAVPHLQAMYAKYKHHGLEIIGLSYESAAGNPAENVRNFAIDHGLTYHLALGTPALTRQVQGFRDYPTLLCFNRNLEFDHAWVGFTPDSPTAIEAWVRRALDLAPLESTDSRDDPATDNAIDDQTASLPPGVIFKPGDGDTGFAFVADDLDGKRIDFEQLRGKPVLLALTSTWDQSATITAALLDAIHRKRGTDCHVLAAYLELRAPQTTKLEAIRTFRAKHGLGYRLFLSDLGMQKKIHMFSGMPMFLLFDDTGRLALRESGTDDTAETGKALDATRAKIELLLDHLAPLKPGGH